jgi:hypothetical protein
MENVMKFLAGIYAIFVSLISIIIIVMLFIPNGILFCLGKILPNIPDNRPDWVNRLGNVICRVHAFVCGLGEK